MELPAALKKQEAEVEELYKQMYSKEEETQDETSEEEEVEEEEEETETEEEESEPEEEEEESSESPSDALHRENEELKAELAKKEHSLSVLKGKYNAEVPRLHDELRNMRAEIAEIKAIRVDGQREESGGSNELEDLEAEYGEEFISDMMKLFESRFPERIKSVEEKVTRVEQNNAAVARERYFSRLSELVPDWQEVRDEPGFRKFLGEIDDFTGISRLDLATQAEAASDSRRVAAFYNAYKATKPQRTPIPKKKKEKSLAPSSTAGKGRTVDSETKKPVITREFIRKFGREVIDGVYDHDPDEQKRIERMINTAIANREVE